MKKNIFNSIALPKVKTNRFDLSHDVKMSFSMGELVPTCCIEVLPGDKFRISTENMLRFAPMISPVMHRVRVTTHYFFVPTRILWPNWEKWITGESDVQVPFTPVGLETDVLINEGSSADYLGYPTGNFSNAPLDVSPFPIVAYNKIFNEWYRDQNLQDPLPDTLSDGVNEQQFIYDAFIDPPHRRAWQHDYFTASLPFAQKGDAVQIPLVVQDNIPVELQPTGDPAFMTDLSGVHVGIGDITQDPGPVPFAGTVRVDGEPALYDPNGSLVVDVQADATDINTLRRAFRLQEWLERNARGGTRYVENILAHFGVKSSDARLQRPELIGTSRQNMVISEVLSTAENTDANVPVGQMAGHGISVGGGNYFDYRAEEHGFLIGIINVQPDTAYQQGLPRMLTRFDRLDYAWPTFANIGEQEVKLKEIYAAGPDPFDPEATFGYVPRYAEYKYCNSRVAGEMKSSLAFWHLGRIFENPPALNEDFVKCNPSTRIFAVTDPNEDHIFAHVFNNISAIRKLPKFGVPTI